MRTALKNRYREKYSLVCMYVNKWSFRQMYGSLYIAAGAKPKEPLFFPGNFVWI